VVDLPTPPWLICRSYRGRLADTSAVDLTIMMLAKVINFSVGSGLDGDETVDTIGATVVPGLFDCHTHMMMSGVDLLAHLSKPFSLPFFEAVGNLRTTVACGITSVRDAGGGGSGP